MKTINRRSFLKNLARMSSVAAAAPLMSTLAGCARDRSLMLNVALHGLYVLNVTDACIELLTPRVHDHRYKAGSWDVNKICHLRDGRTYALRGVRHEPQPPTFDGSLMPVFSKSDYNIQVQPDESFCRVILPFPSAFSPRRHCTADTPYVAGKPAATPNGPCDPSKPNNICITAVSLCPVLTYVVPDRRDLELTHTWWRPDIHHETNTANLHLWAEPEGRLTPFHADRAYAKLSDLVPPLSLTLKVYSTVPLDRDDTGISGFPPEQEQGWSDWQSDGGEGAYPTNCCAMVLKSTRPKT